MQSYCNIYTVSLADNQCFGIVKIYFLLLQKPMLYKDTAGRMETDMPTPVEGCIFTGNCCSVIVI